MRGKVNEQELAGYLARSGQFLLPMVDLIEQCRLACDELIDVTGRAAIDAVLQLSAGQAAGGPAQQGKRRHGEVVFHGSHRGQLMLSDRKLEVQRPRLRTRGQAGREVEVPAYAAMQNGEQMGARMLEILMRGVSTRNYKEVIPSMAETAGGIAVGGEPAGHRGFGSGGRGAAFAEFAGDSGGTGLEANSCVL
jgi:putative transposase